jgi:signal transduction histidine kinase
MRTRRGRLLRKYAIVFGALVGGALIAGSVVQLYFSFQESQSALLLTQRAEASRAALRISQFVDGIKAQLSAILPPPDVGDVLPREQRLADFMALQRRAPEIDELRFIDRNGLEQVRVSRTLMNQIGSGTNQSREPEFMQTRTGASYIAGVEFRDSSEPFFRIAIPEGREAGVTVATVNLQFAHEPVSSIRVGAAGHGYVVDQAGRLIAHPDLSQVLRLTDLSSLPQVRRAIQSTSSSTAAMTAQSAEGIAVLTAFELIPSTGWAVFVEQRLDEALAPLTASIWRTVGILAIGLAMALIASLLLSRRMVEPIEAIRMGAARLGEGALDQRIEIATGDELEDLAGEFNQMATRLRNSYSTLEQKVEDRTRDLGDALAEIDHKNHQLELASRNKSEFLANMSHELRTPLNSIIGFSELLLEKLFGDLNDTQVGYVRDILASGNHQLAVINDVLDMSKVEAGRLELERSAVPLAVIVTNAVTFVRARATQSGIEVSEELAADIGEVEADERKLKQVLVNLLANAVKFTPRGGRVLIKASRTDGEVRIAVSDTGKGMAPEELDRVFREFGQTASSRGHEGTGLGLALAKRLVELHGGRIWVESILGHGSTFTVALPASGHER